ncbi:uncharacterized protein I303_100758 [Kwoniella dejecticola CBS 10117]|uniref:Ribosomal protein s17 n=1 Tax=Kwoniella dejecticola CBS 10117 TaxID=1296121 RepID=A0A1A6AFT8_9TREE|nr:uncharacterized protein I303_00760 [Kwoniella dejecticola CBS 10117]OBR88942.1 hypothetical protein I303_00760 [Kwoniella dejecticola CBS 10117]
MRGFTISLLTSLLLLSDAIIARPGIHRHDAPDLAVRQVSTTSASSSAAGADCSSDATAARVLIGGRQNNGGRFGQGGGRGGGGRGGNRGGAGNANAGANAGGAGGAAAGAGAGGNAAAGGNNNVNGGGANNNNNNGGNNNNNGGGNNNNGGDNSGADANAGNNNNAGNAAAPPVAANENGAPGPAVPVLQFNGGTRLNNAVIQSTQANPNATANQAASAVSNNNFIDFCVGQTITNGLQNKAGSCNPVPIGQIPSTQNMISTMFVSPKNMETIQAGQTFTIGLQTTGMTMGSFVNAQKNYYAAPQQIDGSGQIVGHAHVTLQPMKAIDDTSVLDPNTFTFFKGLDLGDVNGLSTIDVQGGVPAGAYRLCTIMSASNHQSVILPVAQRGAENTCSYFIAA